MATCATGPAPNLPSVGPVCTDWFTNGPNGPYHTLVHCMGEDWFWITVVLVASFFTLAAYMVIAADAFEESKKHSRQTAVGLAFKNLCYLFVLCGTVGYGFNLVRTVWPAYKLMAIGNVLLAAVAWRFVIHARRSRLYEQFFAHQCDIEKMQRDLDTAAREWRAKQGG